jgi:hypothetical protein
MRYQVQIEAANVPEDLSGAPLSVEIISQDGYAKRVSLPLSQAPIVQDVDGPGSYLIRATLPSGRQISNTVATPEQPDPAGDLRATAVLNLKDQDALADLWREAESLLRMAAAIKVKEQDKPLPSWIGDRAKNLVGIGVGHAVSWFANSVKQWSSPRIRSGATAPPGAPESSGSNAAPAADGKAVAAAYDWGAYLRWRPAPAEQQQMAIPTLMLRRCGSGTIGPSGEIPAPQHSDDRVEPWFIKVAGSSEDDASLIIWWPGHRLRPAKVLPDPDRAAHRSGSALLAFADSDDPTATMSFLYIVRGALEEARVGLPVLVAALKRDEGVAGSDRGVLAGYVLYKLGDPYADDLIPRLCAQSPKLADVHVLAAAQLIAAGKTEQAIEQAAAAFDCGVPVYTEGVKLLRDATSFLRDRYPDNKSLYDNAHLAASIAAAANFKSILTCVRLGEQLDAVFDDG